MVALLRNIAMMVVTLVLLISAPTVKADDVAYYGFEPEIVTNYVSSKGNKKLGYVRMSVELMLESQSFLTAVEHHEPMLRDTIIEIINQETEETVKSLAGRNTINKKCFDAINAILTKETGKPLVKKVIFTTFLYE